MSSINSRSSLAILVGVCAAFIIGNISQFTGLWFVGAVITDLDFTASKAGLILTLEYLGISISALSMSSIFERVSFRKIALVGAIGAIVFHALSIFAESYLLLLTLRFVSGLFAGAAFAASSAVVASLSNPDKTYGQIQMFAAAIGAITLYTTGYVSAAYGYKGIFMLLILVCAVALPMLQFLPSKESIIGKTERVVSEESPRFFGLGGGVVLAMLLFNLCEGSSFVFLERLGSEIGFDQQDLSWIFGTGGVVGVCGGILAATLNVRLGRMLPIIVGFGINSIVVLAIYMNSVKIVYWGLFYLIEIFWFFCLPYIFGAAAAIDGKGRVAAMTSGAMLLGIAIGPVIGGFIADQWGLHSIGWFGLTTCLLSMLILVKVVKSMEGGEVVGAKELSC